MFWDDERQTEWIKQEYGWKETEMEGAYKGYKSAECIMAGMHDFTCYLKRGFGRSTWQAAVDIRNGLLTKKEAFKLIRQYEQVRPEALDYFMKITGIKEDEFYDHMNSIKLNQLKHSEIPVYNKTSSNLEKIVPFVEQIIDKHLNEPDPRVKRDNV